MLAKSLQTCLTLCNDCSSSDSSPHGISLARILEWIAIPSSRGSSWPRDRTCFSWVFCISGAFFTTEETHILRFIGIFGVYMFIYMIMPARLASPKSAEPKSLFESGGWKLLYLPERTNISFWRPSYRILSYSGKNQIFFCSGLQIVWGPGLPGRSDSKESACNAGDLDLIPGSGRSPEKGMTTQSSILAWRIPRTEEPGGLKFVGLQRVRHNWATNTFILLGGGNMLYLLLLLPSHSSCVWPWATP